MDKVGVDGDLHLRLSMYRYDASYAVEVTGHPGRLVVKPVDPDDPRWPMSSPTGRSARYGRHPHHDDEGGKEPNDPGPTDPARGRKARFSGQHAVWGNVDAGAA
jgi:hypothetical protein